MRFDRLDEDVNGAAVCFRALRTSNEQDGGNDRPTKPDGHFQGFHTAIFRLYVPARQYHLWQQVKFLLVILVAATLSGCTMVSNNRVFPKFTWYWTAEAKEQRKSDASAKAWRDEYARTNHPNLK